MENGMTDRWIRELALGMFLIAVMADSGFAQSGRISTPQTVRGQSSVTEKLISPWKRGASKVSQWMKPAPTEPPMDEAISLYSKSEPSAKLFVSLAHLYETKPGKLPEASKQYEKALETEPDYLGALLGYARLKDRADRPNEAATLYQQAIKAHPNSAPAHNNYGLFCAKHGRLDESARMLERAIEIAPLEVKYRNNIAPVYVQMGRNGDAFTHLQAAHGDAIAYYNLGYHLEKKGNTSLAREHFAMALKIDESLSPARVALKRCSSKGEPDQERPSIARRATNREKVRDNVSRTFRDNRPSAVRQLPPPPPISPPTPTPAPLPRRLPPTVDQ